MAAYIIAEVGVNHNGDIDLATKLIEKASLAGADAVKFQSFDPSSLVVKEASKANYQIHSDGKGTQHNMLSRLHLTLEDHRILKKACDRNSIEFLSTPFGLPELSFLIDLGIPAIKIASGDITYLPLLIAASRLASSKKIPVYLSTGMSNLSDVSNAFDALVANGLNKDQIYLMHCVSSYPTASHDANLRSLLSLASAFQCNTGYSDHTLGITAPIIAIAYGAQVIEKHLTLDRNMVGPDHAASLEPEDFSKLVDAIRTTELMLGSGFKAPCEAEISTRFSARRSVRAKHFIPKGTVLSDNDFVYMRPSDGLSPMLLDDLVGKVTAQDFYAYDLIKL